MPFLFNFRTRDIIAHHKAPAPSFKWMSVRVDIYRVQEGGLGPEYTPCSIRALSNESTGELIVQSLDDAWDIEYWTREARSVTMHPGPPSPIYFPSTSTM